MEVFAPEADKLAVTTEFAKVVFSILESSYVTPNIFGREFCRLRQIWHKRNLVFGVNGVDSYQFGVQYYCRSYTTRKAWICFGIFKVLMPKVHRGDRTYRNKYQKYPCFLGMHRNQI